MENAGDTSAPRSIKEILLPLFIQVGTSDFLRADSLGFWRDGQDRFWLPRFVFQRTQVAKPRIQIGIFAGIHGDEQASVLGLIDFVRELSATRNWDASSSSGFTRSAIPPASLMARVTLGPAWI